MPSTLVGDAAPDALRALVADDERNIRKTLGLCLESFGCRAVLASNAREALEALERHAIDLAFVDLRFGEANGLDVLGQLLATRPRLPIVIVTAYASVDSAVEAMRRGAVDYLPKPFTPAQIQLVVDRQRAQLALTRQVASLEAQLKAEVPEAGLTTASPAQRAVLDIVTRAATSDAPILLRGENGTGKGVLARTIHAQSRRREHPFATVSCPTLTEELLTSELFGHARGAFTGAVRDQPGRVESAERGTLFLDEIGEIPPSLQAKLLRFVQERNFERVGESRTRHADVRLIAATNRDLDADVAAGRFREDLLYRLNVVEIRVPALRERPEDLLPMARRFLAFFAAAAGRKVPVLAPDAELALTSHSWPGNLRELRNAMERIIILWPGERVPAEALPGRIAGRSHAAAAVIGADLTLEMLEREHIARMVGRTATREEAARILGVDPSTLWRKLRRWEET